MSFTFTSAASLVAIQQEAAYKRVSLKLGDAIEEKIQEQTSTTTHSVTVKAKVDMPDATIFRDHGGFKLLTEALVGAGYAVDKCEFGESGINGIEVITQISWTKVHLEKPTDSESTEAPATSDSTNVEPPVANSTEPGNDNSTFEVDGNSYPRQDQVAVS